MTSSAVKRSGIRAPLTRCSSRLIIGVRDAHMKREKNTSNWTPDKKISWAASLLVVVLTTFLALFLKSIGAVDLERGTWWVGLAVGCVLAVALNWLRPRYDRAGRFWKPIYRFLLEQMPPPD